MEQIVKALKSLRAPLSQGEYDLHALVADALAAAGVEYIHEAPLGRGRRIDFLCGAIGIEVKRGRPAPGMLKKQLAGYLESDKLTGLILVAERTASIPNVIGGKPVKIVSLNRLWGIAL
ncbi:MAG: hypothetical protein IJ461_08335 [Clostridia bacterium]|nr:hypothetical protein [Clostridia bacterium]